jgi:peptide-methionine (R)-S-oxide reductase
MKTQVLAAVLGGLLLAGSALAWRSRASAGESTPPATPGEPLKLYSEEAKGYVTLPAIVKTEAEWKAELTPMQFQVARKAGTERAFTGASWNEHRKGIYRCVACGTDLFRSDTKFESGTGWPSFWEPISEHNVRLETDRSWFMERVEVLCARWSPPATSSRTARSRPPALLHELGRPAVRPQEVTRPRLQNLAILRAGLVALLYTRPWSTQQGHAHGLAVLGNLERPPSRRRTSSGRAYQLPQLRGVSPLASLASRDAPAASSMSMVSTPPKAAARWRGVSPFVRQSRMKAPVSTPGLVATFGSAPRSRSTRTTRSCATRRVVHSAA